MTDFVRLEQVISDLRRDVSLRIDAIDAKIQNAAIQASAALSQIVAHSAVCDERQRQLERRQEDRRIWEQERAEEWRLFMVESRADRSAIRDSVQMNAWRILLAIVVANILAAAGTIFASKPGLFAGMH